jgi:hypothetical protein
MSTSVVIQMSKKLNFYKKFHGLSCNISGLFCVTKTVLSIINSAMPQQNFEHLLIHIALFKQTLRYFKHFHFLRLSKLARVGSIQVLIG